MIGVYWTSYLEMNSSEQKAKEWWPKAEHSDIRAYVEKNDFDKLLAASREMDNAMNEGCFCQFENNEIVKRCLLCKARESFRNTLKEMGLEDE